ncbi:MAG: hypothetical protein AAFY98_04785 [Verrucomicrobiota bacterium]
MRTFAPHLLLTAFYLFSAQSGWTEIPEDADNFHLHLIHAQNVRIEDDQSIDSKLRKKLVTLFGYDKYRSLGEASSPIQGDESIRLKASDLFHLRLTSLPKPAHTYQFELVQGEKMVFRGKVQPKPEVPIIIRGPFYDEGNLILVIKQLTPTSP